jgi:alpha-1,2-mannosyltransferase
MRHLRLPACVALYGGSIALYGGSVALLLASHLGHGWGFLDLAVYRKGGQALLDGARLYALRFPGALAFTYPPIAAMLFAGLTLLSPAADHVLVTAASLALLPAMLYCALRLEPSAQWLTRRHALVLAFAACAGAVWLEPVWTTLRYGQIDVLIATLVLYDLSRPDSARSKGVGIGLASALKLTPAIFVVYLALTGRLRAAGLAVAVFCTTVAAGFAAVPGDSREFWGGAFLQSNRVGRVENAANQALRGAYARLAHTVDVQTPWLISAAALALVGIALAVSAGRGSGARSRDDVRGFSLCALTGLLVSPISWSHHWTLAVPALLLLAVSAYRQSSAVKLAACATIAIVAASHMIWWVPINRPPHSELHLDAPQLVFADAYVLIALTALAIAGWETLAHRPRRAPTNSPCVEKRPVALAEERIAAETSR